MDSQKSFSLSPSKFPKSATMPLRTANAGADACHPTDYEGEEKRVRAECHADEFQDLIQKLRTYAPKVAIALGAISHMLGDGDPSKPEYSHIPRIPVPQGDKSVLMKEVKLLKEAFKKIIEHLNVGG